MIRSIYCLLIVGALLVSGCQTGSAGPDHEMSATGISSQVPDGE